MDLYSPMAKHFVHPIWAFKDGEKHLSLWRELEQSQYWSLEDLQQLQMARLKLMLSHAYNNCPFYKKRFDEARVSPSDITSVSDLRAVPFLTKEDIQNHKEEMKARDIPESMLMPDQTGGSTGKPLRYYRDRRRADYLRAGAMRHDRWAGHEIGNKLALIWGSRQDLSMTRGLKWRVRNTLLDRRLILDSSSITEDRMLKYVESLRRFRPKTILAYANSCALFASFLLKKDIRDIHVESVITSAEMLHDAERQTIEKAFGCKVFNRYGCREVGVIASECEAHSGLHINAECLLVEFVSGGSAVEPGKDGDIIITDLLNFGMPLIRYRIEDIGVPTNRRCSCGRGLPLMEMVAGRVTDFLLSPNGQRISGVFLATYLITNAPGVRQVQIVQDANDSLLLRIVRGAAFNDDSMSFFHRKVAEFLGCEMKIKYEFVDAIHKEPSGKYRFSICNLRSEN